MAAMEWMPVLKAAELRFCSAAQRQMPHLRAPLTVLIDGYVHVLVLDVGYPSKRHPYLCCIAAHGQH